MSAADTFPKLLLENAARIGNRPASREKDLGIWQTWNWAQVADEIRALACGLAAMGFQRGDKLIIVGDNRPRLYWAMTAAQAVGGVPVPVYQDSAAKEMAFVVEHAEARFALAEDQEQVDKLLEIRETVPGLEQIIFSDPRGLRNYGQDFLHGFDAVQEMGREYDRASPDFYEKSVAGGKGADTSVMLYTSGTTGNPKGVVLSHANLEANRQQLSACIDFSPSDRVFNALPIFHSFGLTGGTLLPLLSGVRTFMYPSPLHYRIVPEMVYDTNATIMFGTDTFLTGYARSAHPYDFYSLRYVFAGAEKVKEVTRRVWAEQFGVRIFEGYGATETAPALSTNTPMHYRAGTVGRLLPGIEHRLVPVPGIDEGGRLEVKGPNVMLGYFKPDNPGVLEPPEGGWYDTGDIVTFDEDGFITIQGRAKRFAKIAGEMVSLTAVEGYAAATWPENAHAVVAVPDDRKGEQLILVTDCADAVREALMAQIKASGGPELACPRDIVVVEEVPLLGSGKTDYPSVQKLVG